VTESADRGPVQATGSTVNYPQGTIFGLSRYGLNLVTG